MIFDMDKGRLILLITSLTLCATILTCEKHIDIVLRWKMDKRITIDNNSEKVYSFSFDDILLDHYA